MKSRSITGLCKSLFDLVLNKYCSKIKSSSMSYKLDSLFGREFSLTNEILLPKYSTLLFFFPIPSRLYTMITSCGSRFDLV